ncbi:hypothetical protein ACTWP5_24160 [Streptomyces sp. 4N509B]|uniref:hypothetical protein n=1 Tax=Streptomyces sp. 4N509B TaxID=3457413 RepID=UPI003FD5BCA2
MGTETAATAIPAAVPRPVLRNIDDWVDGEFAYRAELFSRVTQAPIIADGPTLRTETALDGQWWLKLRNALHLVSEVPTDRIGVRQEYVDRAMPEFLGFLGRPVNTTVPAWSTAHGDLHWANMTAPELVILDWEGWGLAPAGFDAATLHTHSLLVPRVAERLRKELGDVLSSPAGRFSELVVITILLQTNTRGDNLELTAALRERAAYLLGG